MAERCAAKIWLHLNARRHRSSMRDLRHWRSKSDVVFGVAVMEQNQRRQNLIL
jgi:hypothetical protein